MKITLKNFQLLLIVVLLIAGCGGGKDDTAPAETREGKIVEVKAVVSGYLSLERPVSGVLLPVNDAMVSAQVSGNVESIVSDEGEHIGKGDVVVKLDDGIASRQLDLARAGYEQAQAGYELAIDPFREEDITQAHAALEAAQTSYDVASADHERNKLLFDEGVISEQQLNYSEQALQGANAALVQASETLAKMESGPRAEEIESARAGLASAEANYRLASESYSYSSIRSPFSGIVAEVYVDTGELVAPGMPVFRVVDPSVLLIETSLADNELAGLNVGDEIGVTVDALTGKTFTGKLSYIAPAADALSHTFKVQVSIANDSESLKPGMVAHARLTRDASEARLLVPVEALLTEDGNRYLFVLEKGEGSDGDSGEKNGVVRKRAVTVANFSSEYAEVTSGVNEGDLVVIRGIRGLADEDEVSYYESED